MRRGVRYGQPYIRPTGAFLIVAQVVAPEETVIVSRDGATPGERVDPEEWAAAYFDPKREAWIVPDAPREIA